MALAAGREEPPTDIAAYRSGQAPAKHHVLERCWRRNVFYVGKIKDRCVERALSAR
jgi:hypothetical protein